MRSGVFHRRSVGAILREAPQEGIELFDELVFALSFERPELTGLQIKVIGRELLELQQRRAAGRACLCCVHCIGEGLGLAADRVTRRGQRPNAGEDR